MSKSQIKKIELASPKPPQHFALININQVINID